MKLAPLALLLALCTPANAGCHINIGQLWCDPDLNWIIPGLHLGIRIAPNIAIPPLADRPIVTAAYLVEACASPEPTRQAGCAGFISGVADAYASTGQYCMGDDKFVVEGSVIEYLHRVPMQGLSATDMVLEALRANFPCR